MATIRVTLVRSLAGQLRNIAASARGLGLRKVNHSVTVQDTPQNRGLVHTVRHLEASNRVPSPAAGNSGGRHDSQRSKAKLNVVTAHRLRMVHRFIVLLRRFTSRIRNRASTRE